MTPFERYMVLDDRRGYPMIFVAQIDFAGPWERERLEAAFRKTLARHSALRSTVQGRRHWRPPVPVEQLPGIQWRSWTDETPDEAFARIDISREPGVRFFVQQRADRSRWTVEAHHAASDGAALARFCWEVGAAYAALGSGVDADALWQPEAVAAPRPAATAGEDGTTNSPTADAPPVSEIMEFVLRRPVPVRASGNGSRRGVQRSRVPLVDYTFDPEAFNRLRRAARAHDAAVNDLFLAALFQTLAEWNAAADSDRWLRILVPTDLRPKHDTTLGAENTLGYALLDRRLGDCHDATKLLRSVRDEMHNVRTYRIGRRLLDGLALVDRVPGLLSLVLRRRSALATVVFSNIGRVGTRVPSASGRGADHFGEAMPALTRVRGAVPLRPGTRAGFVLARLRNSLTLTLRTDPRYLGSESASKLLAATVESVHNMANGHTHS